MAAPAEEAAAEPDEEALRRLEELVSELLRFRDGLPAPPAPGNGAGRDPLEEEMEKTLKLMEEVEVSPEARGRALVLRARALGVCEAGSRRAEEALSRAVKLEPALAAAWTRLGERRWHRGDLEGARACFAGALQHGEDAEARRLLSMVLRAGAAPGGSPGPLRQSLAQAEAAVRCDPRDGRSWYVLGNAYVALFFSTGQSPDLARRALAAYAQAERVDPEAAKNPDLHLNRATVPICPAGPPRAQPPPPAPPPAPSRSPRCGPAPTPTGSSWGASCAACGPRAASPCESPPYEPVQTSTNQYKPVQTSINQYKPVGTPPSMVRSTPSASQCPPIPSQSPPVPPNPLPVPPSAPQSPPSPPQSPPSPSQSPPVPPSPPQCVPAVVPAGPWGCGTRRAPASPSPFTIRPRAGGRPSATPSLSPSPC
ncbi:tetratricopeptide repeat protein 5 isoform X2 [Phaenicophaeus curvirostris]|uniref:tetratricopeptide repeat protein 5 isoform X2 n=1 Tax=Phaenicophaeus curvirostris TaxID=33595 RepID=UPI0037F0D303